MFFTIDTKQDTRFPNNLHMGKWVISYDQGWSYYEGDNYQLLFKGYGISIDELVKNPVPAGYGNFVSLVHQNDKITVTHDLNRSFPLWRSDRIVTNLKTNSELKTVYSDSYVVLNHDNIEEHSFIAFDVYDKKLSLNEAIDEIENLLVQKTNTVNEKLNVFLTGGIDTALLYSLIRKQNLPHQLINYEHFEFDEFACKNAQDIRRNHWAYTQMHHWIKPTWLASGAMGDEIFLRGPTTISLWAAWHNYDLIDLLDINDYHNKYFKLEKNLKIFRSYNKDYIREQYPTEKDLRRQILDMNINDHQHWHLGNTICWTPFKDVRITEILLRLNPEVLLSQMLNADISREIIRRFDPNFIQYINDDKNLNSKKKLYKLLELL